MKTNQILVRKMGQFDVLQRTSDGYFDGNALLRLWNNSIHRKTTRKRQMSEFLDSPETNSFIETIKNREMQSADNHHERKSVYGDYQVVKEIKGRNTKKGKTADQTWMHPFLFIDFAMWINPEFKYEVIKFVYDELVKYRNDAGDAYKEMASAIAKIVEKPLIGSAMADIAKALNYVIFNSHEKQIRNTNADENKLRELYELEKEIAKLITFDFITTYNELKIYLRKLWFSKWSPKVLTA